MECGDAPVAVFGGTGFLGRRVVAHLRAHGAPVRVVARHPGHAGHDGIEPCAADVRDAASVRRAVDGVRGVVNAVSLYVERGDLSFDAIHVAGAATVGLEAARAGVTALAHVSGIGADSHAEAPYVCARGAGEEAVQATFPGAAVVRPSVLFGPGDAFVNLFDRLTRHAPLFPLFGDGTTRLAPVWVDDLAEALARLALGTGGEVYELGGGQVLRYRDVVERVLARRGRRRWLLPVPLPLWRLGAACVAWLPNPPVTRDQITLAARDNLPDPARPGFSRLGIAPRRFDDALDEALAG